MQKPFQSKPGQVDYTYIRYAPVINCLLKFGDKILLVERSSEMRLYPGLWNGVAGFLDDDKSVEKKAAEEIMEETGLSGANIVKITRGNIFEVDAPAYKKTWIIHPVLVEVNTDKVKLDWEAKNYRWLLPNEARELKLVPGFDKVISSFGINF